MQKLETLRERLPDYARDLKLNVTAVLGEGTLNKAQIWGTALACAYYLRDREFEEAILDAAQSSGVDATVIEDGKAAAGLLAMNTVLYRFRHLIGKESYAERPARLRMQRIVKPATNKTDFELFSLGVAALAGCEMCLKAHERAVLEGGLGEEHVNEAIRIASAFYGFVVALETTRV